MQKKDVITGDYEIKGTYHEELDPKWRYYPVYIAKKEYVISLLENEKKSKILDMGCGEGVFVKELKSMNFNIEGLDFNFESEWVKKGSILAAPYPDHSFDVVMCLDVIEHLNPNDQPQAFKEIYRILKPGGRFICSLPNLAHLASRVSFFFLGKLLRTATIDRHPGDRPYGEFKNEIKTTGFMIENIKSLFLTTPFLCLCTIIDPKKSLFFHRLYNWIFNIPSLSFLVIFDCKKGKN